MSPSTSKTMKKKHLDNKNKFATLQTPQNKNSRNILFSEDTVLSTISIVETLKYTIPSLDFTVYNHPKTILNTPNESFVTLPGFANTFKTNFNQNSTFLNNDSTIINTINNNLVEECNQNEHSADFVNVFDE